MSNQKIYESMNKLGKVIAYLNIIAGYCEYNLNSKEMSFVLSLIEDSINVAQTAYNELDVFSMQIFDFEINNLK